MLYIMLYMIKSTVNLKTCGAFFEKYLKKLQKSLDKCVFKAYNNICKEVIKHEKKRFSKTA